MSEHKGHEQHEIENISDHIVDHISNLPDCILEHILSFMPTKEVVKTSILSTRWKNLWASVPNIDIDDNSMRDTNVDRKIWLRHDVTSFMNFVERVLRLRGASNIKKFRLTCLACCSYGEPQIHSWISDAIMHNVQELDLNLLGGPSRILWSILDRTSLVSLKITAHDHYVTKLPELPYRISFPCLKTLHLRCVAFPDERHGEKLFLGCPVLEELVLSHKWMNSKNILISSFTLKSLTIHDMLLFGAYDDPTSGCHRMKIDAANLTYFEYDGFLSHEIILNNASSLVKACINILARSDDWQKLIKCRAVNLLKGLQYVVSLSLSNPAIESLMCTDNMGVRFPKFEILSHLTLTREIRRKTFGALIEFLYLCPNLQSICLSQGFDSYMLLGKNDPIWLSLGASVSNCLRKVTLKKYHAYDSEICFLKCILKYARVLERMDIWWSWSWSKTSVQDVKRKAEVRTEFETFERSSIACVIKFYEIS